MAEPTHFHFPSYLQGEAHAELKARVSALEDWRTRLESYAADIRSYLRRGAIVVLVWGLGMLTAALPGSPIAAISDLIGLLLKAD